MIGCANKDLCQGSSRGSNLATADLWLVTCNWVGGKDLTNSGDMVTGGYGGSRDLAMAGTGCATSICPVAGPGTMVGIWPNLGI